jgi:carbon-monoxide dehydrogenase large subunit
VHVVGSLLGTEVVRVEDPELLQGKGTYVDNLAIDGVLHLVFVRSPFAHAELRSVDTAAAAAAPGVVAVFAAADLDLPAHHGLMVLNDKCARPPLARDRVRFVGDPVAVVVAETRTAAVDAAELVDVDYEPLEAVVDPEAALAPDAPLQFPELGSNLAGGFREPTGFDPLAGSEVVVRGRFVNQRMAVVPMEGNAIAVVPGQDPELTVYVSTQMPHALRGTAAKLFDLPDEQVRVVAPHVGGGFGAKAGLAHEHTVVIAAARRLGRPVKWVETRSENLTAMPHGRGQVQYVEMGFRADGEIVGLRCRMIGDSGAYAGFGGALPIGPTRTMAQGVYRIPRIGYDVATALTNTTPMGAFRGAGRPEASAFLERLMDLAADQLDIDPARLRQRNLLTADQFPYTTATGTTYDSGDYQLPLVEALRLADYDGLRAEQARRRAGGDPKLLGIGLAVYVEITGGGAGNEYGAVEVHEDGSATIKVGTSAHGQGHATSFAMLVSDTLGIPMDRVRFVQSDTAARRRHRRLPVVAAGRQRGARRGRGRAGPGPGPGRRPAGGRPGGHRGHRGRPAGRAWRARRRHRVVPAGPAQRRAAGRAAGRVAGLHQRRGHLPVRRARLGGRGRLGDRPGHPDPAPGGGRLRPDREPAAGPRPAARRRGPGHRPGAVGGVPLRRGRQPGHFQPGRVHHPDRGRDVHRGDRQHGDRNSAQPVGGQGNR